MVPSNILSNPIIAGIDEAGRGCLAGPVMACACILPTSGAVPEMIQDSKALSPADREKAMFWIAQHCTYAVGLADAQTIDRIGILSATETAMQQAVATLSQQRKPTYLLVDGRDKFWFDIPHSSVIHGDVLERCIAAASIVAKVTRDRMMQEAHRGFPLYHFDAHKGYGTPEHFAALAKHGPCAIHRKTFLENMRSPRISARRT